MSTAFRPSPASDFFPCGGRSMALFEMKKMRLKGKFIHVIWCWSKNRHIFLSSRNISDVFDFDLFACAILICICWCFYHGKKLHMQKNLRQMPIDKDFVITNLHWIMTISFSNHPFCIEWVLEHVDGAEMLGLKKTIVMFPLCRTNSYQFTKKDTKEA